MAGSTQNGHPIDPALKQYNVPNTNVTLTLIADGDLAAILLFGCQVHNAKVKPLDKGQCGGYDKRPIGGLGGSTSNHRSGTACDLNYTVYPQGTNKMNASQQAGMRAAVKFCEGALRWGGDYTGTLDQHHIEINTTDRNLIKRIAQKVRGGGEGVAATTSPDAVVGSTPTAQTAGTAAVVKEPLPPIGPAAQHEVIPLTGVDYVSEENRFGEIKIAGKAFTGEISNAVIGCTMSYSATQIGQFSLTIADTDDGALIGSGIFDEGTTIDYGDQHLDVRSVNYSASNGGPTLAVKARSRVISILRGKEHQGRGSWGEQDVSSWVRDRCREAGAHHDVQNDLGTMTFTRQEYDQIDTTWDVMQRAAKQVGALCFEYEQVIVFMRPSQFRNRPRVHLWDIHWNSWTDYSPGITGMPNYGWDLDSNSESMTFQLCSGDNKLARPGDIVNLTGNVSKAAGEWYMTSVDVPVNNTEAVNVSCARIVDPEPQTAG